MLRNTLIAIAAILIPVGLAVAGERGGGGIAGWDANSDGIVTRDEAGKAAIDAANKRFDALDANKDGQLTKEELAAAREQRQAGPNEKGAERFKAADTNGDGALSKEEVTAGMPRLARNFDRLDADKDGSLSPDELRNAMAQRRR
jgi:Ca2+-binding EF-hand superfamily protein